MTVSAREQIISDPLPDQSKQKSCSNCGIRFTFGLTSAEQGGCCEASPHISLIGAADHTGDGRRRATQTVTKDPETKDSGYLGAATWTDAKVPTVQQNGQHGVPVSA